MANYLNKRDMLAALHESKKSFCSFSEPRYGDYHVIVASLDLVTDDLISDTVHRLANPKTKLNPKIIVAPEDIVVRVMSDDHVPDDPERKSRARSVKRPIARTPFPPFIHVIRKDGETITVGKSHWKGTLDDGEFSADHGRISDRLGRMFMLLIDRIGSRTNYRGYSYLAEMKSHALLNLCGNGLQFNEAKSDNPFAFYTTATNNAFYRVLNLEKRQQQLRDGLIEEAGGKGSHASRNRDS